MRENHFLLQFNNFNLAIPMIQCVSNLKVNGKFSVGRIDLSFLQRSCKDKKSPDFEIAKVAGICHLPPVSATGIIFAPNILSVSLFVNRDIEQWGLIEFRINSSGTPWLV